MVKITCPLLQFSTAESVMPSSHAQRIPKVNLKHDYNTQLLRYAKASKVAHVTSAHTPLVSD